MYSSVELFDLVMDKYLISSDNQLSKMLKVTPALISMHRSRRFGMSNQLALRIADLLQYDPAFVLACANYEGAKCAEEKEVFFRLAALAKLNPERKPGRRADGRSSH